MQVSRAIYLLAHRLFFFACRPWHCVFCSREVDYFILFMACFLFCGNWLVLCGALGSSLIFTIIVIIWRNSCFYLWLFNLIVFKCQQVKLKVWDSSICIPYEVSFKISLIKLDVFGLEIKWNGMVLSLIFWIGWSHIMFGCIGWDDSFFFVWIEEQKRKDGWRLELPLGTVCGTHVSAVHLPFIP